MWSTKHWSAPRFSTRPTNLLNVHYSNYKRHTTFAMTVTHIQYVTAYHGLPFLGNILYLHFWVTFEMRSFRISNSYGSFMINGLCFSSFVKWKNVLNDLMWMLAYCFILFICQLRSTQNVSLQKWPDSCALTINSANLFARFIERPTSNIWDTYPKLSTTLIAYWLWVCVSL